ncbi:carotenoid oxygenase [Hypoxylon fragiforme]|uniref:carotenoid oxygenase n=1 Tax=Hypoxylon fragiforme TaxID=63214 RepID=UPI0020C6501C|nr:carotenoid oxygenase [Hypoxylon fragiforme]KAI2604352.1 carotenoid oxygenase [Hypoxylon fragiforme]
MIHKLHPYLTGNFAPIDRTRRLTRCTYTGDLPGVLAGGQYVRNGANPITNNNLGRVSHWFDGDGMLTGVLFRRGEKGNINPEFVNQFVLTDVFLNADDNCNLRRPLLPSIATLIGTSKIAIIIAVLRTIILVVLSKFPGSKASIKKISVANTSVIYHDGRALATCESGPPIRFQLPNLETIGWYNGRRAENEQSLDNRTGFGGDGPMAFMKEWTTGHPHVDPVTKELIAFHAVFFKPFVYYSIVPISPTKEGGFDSVFNMPVLGVRSPKMMHDFGVSARYTVIMDLPLSLNPMNSIGGQPVVSYDASGRSRYGVFPRYEPEKVQWFETNPCVIFHTANCWETHGMVPQPETCVHLLVCRLTSASLLYSAGALETPILKAVPLEYVEEEQCRLYYYSFPVFSGALEETPTIRHQWALSAIPFEFPSLSASYAMREARYIYGCSTRVSSYSPALGRATKIDCLVKIEATKLIARGIAHPPQQIKGCVDNRSISEVMQSTDESDPIKVFPMPEGWFAQEPRFVRRAKAEEEDDGWLLTYVFDEYQLNDKGECNDESVSELWVINARNMRDVVAKVKLPQRVPYGLHGAWFSEDDIAKQRSFTGTRTRTRFERSKTEGFDASSTLSHIRDVVEKWMG